MKKIFLTLIPITLIIGFLSGIFIGTCFFSEKEEGSDFAIGIPEALDTEVNLNPVMKEPDFSEEYDFTSINVSYDFTGNIGKIHPYGFSESSIPCYISSGKKYEENYRYFHEDVIENSIGACTAVFNSYVTNGKVGCWSFTVRDVLYGAESDGIIRVIQSHSNTPYTAYSFQKDHEYLLTFSYRDFSEVYNQLCYRFEGGLLIDLTTMEDFQWHEGLINIDDKVTREEFIEYIENLAGHYGYKKK